MAYKDVSYFVSLRSQIQPVPFHTREQAITFARARPNDVDEVAKVTDTEEAGGDYSQDVEPITNWRASGGRFGEALKQPSGGRFGGAPRNGTNHTHPPGRTRCPKCGV